MKTNNNDILMHNTAFMWVAIITGLILMIPFLAMQFNWQVIDPGSPTRETVNWTVSDFVIMGALLFGIGSMFVLTARKVQTTSNRIIVGVAFVMAFLYIWAELAVGIFTNIGS